MIIFDTITNTVLKRSQPLYYLKLVSKKGIEPAGSADTGISTNRDTDTSIKFSSWIL